MLTANKVKVYEQTMEDRLRSKMKACAMTERTDFGKGYKFMPREAS